MCVCVSVCVCVCVCVCERERERWRGGLQDRKITALHAEPQIHKAHPGDSGEMYVMSSTHKLSLADMYLLVVHTALSKSSPLMN